MILVLIVEAIGEWIAILSGRKAAVLHESPYVATRWVEAPAASGGGAIQQ
jgi:hypothetical protein